MESTYSGAASGIKLAAIVGLVAIGSAAMAGAVSYKVGVRQGATESVALRAQESEAAFRGQMQNLGNGSQQDILSQLRQKSAPTTGTTSIQGFFDTIAMDEAGATSSFAGLPALAGNANFASLSSMLGKSQTTGSSFSGTLSLFGNNTSMPGGLGQTQNMNFCQVVSQQSDKVLQLVQRKRALADAQFKNLQSGRAQTIVNQALEQIKTERFFDDQEFSVNSEELAGLFGQSGVNTQEIQDSLAKLKTAITQHRATLDAALKDYQTSVAPKLQPLLTEATKLAGDIEKALRDAITKAKTDCAAGKDPKVVQADFEATAKLWQKKIDDFMKKVQSNSKSLTDLLSKYQTQVNGASGQFQDILKQFQGDFGSEFLGTDEFFSGGDFPDFSNMQFDYSGMNWGASNSR